MMDSTESERMSLLLSTYLERVYTGTEDIINIKKRATVLGEYLNMSDDIDVVSTGSYGEGCALAGSDIDQMVVNKTVAVMYPDQRIPQHETHKSILYIRPADCRPGYVHLEKGVLKGRQKSDLLLYNSSVRVGNSIFISSDIFREELLTYETTTTGRKLESNGPSVTNRVRETDTVHCFACNSWPKEANEWITRIRLYGWPHQTLIAKIVKSGFHLVPVGDKCSENTFLQWRISFAVAERSLVHSFSHIQVKVYTLLKYFLKQIKETLKKTIGDDDILCSYFLKTIMFNAIESYGQIFWQNKNLFYCFWFCFNILIAWVRAGFCPNYFIPTNNMFLRKVHGQHQKILLDILDNCCQLKWMCLSVGNFHKPSIWEVLCNTTAQTDLVRPLTLQENIMERDLTILSQLPRGSTHLSSRALYLLSTSKTDFEQVFTYFSSTGSLRHRASEMISRELCENGAVLGNKTKYRSLRKCKYWMTPRALIGTDGLYFATFYFLTGNFNRCLLMTRQISKLASYCGYLSHSELRCLYIKHQYHLSQSCTLERLQKMYSFPIIFHPGDMHLPHLCLELSKATILCSLDIPPLPYLLFLNFMCCHELGDTSGRNEALHQLIQIQYDEEQGGDRNWIVYTLCGICYQTLNDYQSAIMAYWKSAQSEAECQMRNPAIERIAIVYLCIYVSQRSGKG
ncbi:uncharacterized protein LOC117336776 [Pecten maximus]|uniref:uncharacterized protein LOC117336776 n=1 Tax=Pecten maximus TaxID=6579 RepID=UPI001457FA7D|nr:uncharacterized protein LOC117336776 [Pecten maximus]